MMSAKSATEKSIKDSNQSQIVENVAHFKLMYNWLPVHTPCGVTFYLNADDYTNVYDYANDVRYFTYAKCGEEQYASN